MVKNHVFSAKFFLLESPSASDGPMIDYNRKLVGLGFRL